MQEIDTPEFWSFLDRAIAGFQDRIERTELKLEDHTPWAKLGQKWHFLRKGFPPGRKISWDVEVLEILHEALVEAAPSGKFLWSNKQVVHLHIKEQTEPWASIYTKKTDGIWLQLNGPKDSVTLGQIAEIAEEPTVRTEEKKDIVRMKFSQAENASTNELKEFLKEHLAAVSA